MSTDGQRTKWRRNIAENFNCLSRAHERYRQTDGRTTTCSERECEFTFGKKSSATVQIAARCRTNQIVEIWGGPVFGSSSW